MGTAAAHQPGELPHPIVRTIKPRCQRNLTLPDAARSMAQRLDRELVARTPTPLGTTEFCRDVTAP
jgi:hypothetical protein